MARILITGSSDGLGLEAGRQLIQGGHRVVLHARSDSRADDVRSVLSDCEAVAVGDVSTLAGMRALADQVRDLGHFDAVIHNVGVYGGEERQMTEDGFERTFAVNVVAPYLLTVTTERPNRLIYLSSSMHRQGEPDVSDLTWKERAWNATQAYCDSKLFVVMLVKSLAERWADTHVNAVDPGWIATRMGGKSAPGGVAEGAATQVWLASSNDEAARITGGYFHNRKQEEPAAAAEDAAARARLLACLRNLAGTDVPD